MPTTLVFDIETIPDADGLRTLYGLDSEVSAQDVVNLALHQRRQSHGNDFLPLHQHRVCVISCALRDPHHFRVWSLGSAESNEEELIKRFFDGIEKYTPNLVSWNGGGFDLPVLHYRAMVYGISAPRYWDMGENDKEFRWNNYINRYQTRHLDMMDLLALYQARGYAPLDEMAKLCGFPGKLGMDGGQVWENYAQGQIEQIRHYCETDVLNTYLVYLRFQLMRGHIQATAYQAEIEQVIKTLEEDGAKHWTEFLSAWRNTPNRASGL